MTAEPDIVRILREEEKLGKMRYNSSTKQELEICESINDYKQADSSRHDFDSSGLGMPICKRIVEKHGGRIWIKSSKKLKGTTIYFTLPKTSKNSIINHNRKNI